MIVSYRNYVIEIFDDLDYLIGSSDNKVCYQHLYNDANDSYCPSSQHGIKVKEKDVWISSALISYSGGATCIHERSFLIKDDRLFICCTNRVYALRIPDLTLIWNIEGDPYTCFQLFDFHGDLLVHGEGQVSRIDHNGNIKWQFGGQDIFVTLTGKDSIELQNDGIRLTDWLGYQYRLNENGIEI